jgi:DNA-binding response OmpR family regulator
LSDIYEAFKEECKNKSIDLKFSVSSNLTGFVDEKKIEKILWNLLSNALKFTQNKGVISLSAQEISTDDYKKLKIVVADNGIGIPENEISQIFDRFYKVQDVQSLNQEGTGIGLSIVKELVEIHHGEINVVSNVGKGATFTIIIPCSKESFSTNELVVFDEPKQELQVDINHEEVNPQDNSKKRYNLLGILIIEDNQELRDYLSSHFEKKYKVHTAEDGFVGLKIAKEINPDIILTDVQMPNMNGYELCKEIRRNFDTSHIPVIMLTANSSIEHQIEGLSTGADVYLTKPFDIKLLDAQVYWLLENRKSLRIKFQGIETPENLEKTLPQKDIDFIFELKLFIEENMLSQDLSVELLSEHFSVSLAQLHRKIKALTGSTPNNMIKSIRLKRAYKLIREGGLRVSEAAYQTGFSDPNYFTICFKKEFGENPSQITNSAQYTKDASNLNANTNDLKDNIILNANNEDQDDQLPLMLIAEDDEDMLSYITSEFKSKYKIITTYNGNFAFDQATNEIPDIIISDVVMPGINGIELCRKLKTDERTSHIPIVLLTVKDTDENILEGIENGADDYISKPFNISILKARVKNLYQSRLLLRNKFIHEPEATVKDLSLSIPDERFINKAYEIVERNLINTDFDVQLFASELSISRSQLYRKIEAVSGQSVNEFIRIVRLKKAAYLLLNSNYSISEIVEKVGFNSFAYFTKSFKDYFKVTPSQYKQ